MSRAAAAVETAGVVKRQPTITRRMGLPKELSADFNVSMQDEAHTEGLVSTENVMDLINAFQVPDVIGVSFPFQKLQKRGGEIWRFRIDPASMHMMEGKPVSMHRWIWVQDLPERTASNN